MTGAGSSCGACKFLRRKCTSECVFVPYFSYNDAASHFAAVHKVFGASNVSKLLMHIPVHHRTEAAFTISYEALARMTDPVFGCVSHIYNLHQQIAKLQEEIEIIGSQMAAGYPPFPCPVSQPQPTTKSLEEMDVEQVTQMMNASGGYVNVVEDQSYVTDQLFPVTCGVYVNSYSVPGMGITNEGLVENEAAQLFCPSLDDSHSLPSYQSVQLQQLDWAGEAQFQI